MNDNSKMFCYQCEQTSGGTGCTKAGSCGKSAAVAAAQDRLTGALVALAIALRRQGGEMTQKRAAVFTEGLFACVTNVNFDPARISALAADAEAETAWLTGDSNRTGFDLKSLWSEPPKIRSLKSLLLFGLRGMGAYAYHAAALGYSDSVVNGFIISALAALADDLSPDALVDLVLALGRANLACMAMLDRANTSVFGTPSPVSVTMEVENGPFIVVTGHDLRDLKHLLEQTDGTGVNIYTHGEMLPAHGYPELRRHRQLKGNFGTAWQNQQTEFDGLPAPILWTSNCLMLPLKSYADSVWTTGPVNYPGSHHVPETADGGKDFSALIAAAKRLGGWPEPRRFTGLNGGHSVTTGFGHDAVTALTGRMADSVRAGRIGHFLVVGGCDGVKSVRNYYTDLVRQVPKDWIVFTLACGKYRFNDLDLGEIDGIPRLMDLGQCNDAYGAIKVAMALAGTFECGVNELPLSFVLSWYEQKAVCILLTLLYLGIRDMRLGPTLPAFVSPEVLSLLREKFALKPITTPEKDLADMMGLKS